MTDSDINTEKSILLSARRIFTIKGFDGARMQEIADDAGINKALLHYYYRTKDKLFEAVFKEVLNVIFPKIISILQSPIPVFEKIEKISLTYIELLKENPDLAIFVFHEISRNPQRLVENFRNAGIDFGIIRKQITLEAKQGVIVSVKAEHLITNLISMCVFPFIAKPVLKGMMGMNEEDFQQFIEERKTVIPHTLISSLTPNK
ncbi:MAG: TetR/AcrR family transcriptional regulator [Bacteroidales bacterium]|jgi:AcrR family transcriptional regulator|nr:TetR/AcrR family transcriptional regulator [Bacteroidales bacterium]